jgi:hypothetical protein
MNEDISTIKDAFKKSGIEITTAEYSITEYSLNTDLSFKFNNLDEFLAFLDFSAREDSGKVEQVNARLLEASIDPDKFFYVNFYKPKVAEL